MEKHKDREFLRREYVEKQKSQNQIARELDCNSGTVNYWLEKYNIESRDRVTELRRSLDKGKANFYTDQSGHERWQTSDTNGGTQAMYVHRLQAIAEFGTDTIAGEEVHHKNGIPWDNRPENLEPMGISEHRSIHASGQDDWEKKKTPWRDKEKLQELYHSQEMPATKVGEKLGCSPSTVKRWLEKHDLRVRDKSEAAYNCKVWENAQ